MCFLMKPHMLVIQHVALKTGPLAQRNKEIILLRLVFDRYRRNSIISNMFYKSVSYCTKN